MGNYLRKILNRTSMEMVSGDGYGEINGKGRHHWKASMENDGKREHHIYFTSMYILLNNYFDTLFPYK